MTEMDLLKEAMRKGGFRWFYRLTPSQQREILDFLRPGEVPIYLGRVIEATLPDSHVRSQHLLALVTNQRLILILFTDERSSHPLFMAMRFKPLMFSYAASVSPLSDATFNVTLHDGDVWVIRGMKPMKRVMALYNFVVNAFEQT